MNTPRVIVALDVADPEKAVFLIERLAAWVDCFKIGLEFLTAFGAPKAVELVHKCGGEVFYDGKFMDIPNTVAAASREVTKLGVKMFNVHCLGGSAMMKSVRQAAEEAVKVKGYEYLIPVQRPRRPLILGVTLLTSLNYEDLVELGIEEALNIADPQELAQLKRQRLERLAVRYLAWLAQESGLDGVIASPQEIKAIRDYCQPGFLVVTPGVRPLWAPSGDQKRVMTPQDAIGAGADYLVIGRPITNPPKEIGDPVKAIQLINEEIEIALRARRT